MNPLPLGIAVATLFFGGLGTLLWGWPGNYAWMAFAPGVLLGATGGHILNAKREVSSLRPGVLVIGLVMGTVAAVVTMTFFWACAAPVRMELSRSQALDAEPETAWSILSDLEQLPNWNPWYTEVEAIGRAEQATPGRRYRVETQLETQDFAAEIEVVEAEAPSRIAWQLDTEDGGRMQQLGERLEFVAHGGTCTVTYTIGFELPTPTIRVMYAFFLGSIFERLVDDAAKGLAALPIP